MVATDVKTTFERLRDEWYRRTSFHSSGHIIFGDPAYQQIIDLGPEIIPYIFEEIKQHRGLWLGALHTLTGADPCPRSARKSSERMRELWMKWGQEHGYTT